MATGRNYPRANDFSGRSGSSAKPILAMINLVTVHISWFVHEQHYDLS
ncbi:hypothetical protein NTGZN8_100020 [Candidatus Nitrotoga fabula]|uniref:Uncharacterized protein n=1 Tax=Candidatus Nitrotoga fabula TaxID=2182327 RepID=A0A916F9A8_9PROT|nr:hypothetical protein NTGZN8_100020 [Candidatus Nitrotoga fabula]